MNRSSLISRLVAAALCALWLPAALAEPLSDTGEHDIGALVDEARKSFDLEAEDAVILLHRERRLWTADQRRIHELHRIVWISTSRGIRSYADLRVPWDSAHQMLEVATLHSWRPRDQLWTESGPTAIVETTPYAFGHAVDYTNVRETMVLHDGVELPCVLEVRYLIEDHEAFAGGMEGVHAMAQADSCLISELILGAPAENRLVVAAGGVGAAAESYDEIGGLHLWTYRSRNLDPLPWPRPAATEVAHVAWSTWANYQTLGNQISARFDTSAVLDETSRAAAEKATEEARSPIEHAEKLAAWVGEATAFIDFDRQWFAQPRPAHRTWATAYGHALDRAVLAAAAFRDAGLHAGLAYRRPHGVTFPDAVATLSPLEGPLLWVAGEGFEGLYDPTDSSLAVGAPALSNDSLWRLGEKPEIRATQVTNSAELRIDISWNADSTAWEGTGMLRADGALSPFARLQGLEPGRALQALETLSSLVVNGAELSGLNFELFAPEAVSAGFALTAKAGERDPQGRLHLEIGDPGASLNDPLHAAGPLHESTHGSTVHLAAPLELVVELHLGIGDLEVVALPEPTELTNDSGRFTLEVEQEDDVILLRRILLIEDADTTADEWPRLRALLLANSSPRNRTLLLK